jgi:hypothetical protein
MDKTKSITTLVTAIILSFVLGALAGVFYQKQKSDPQIKSTAGTIQKLSSRVVNAIVTYGTITSVDNNRNVTLSYDGESMMMSIAQDAKVYVYENNTRKEISFGDVKVGDSVNITAALDAAGNVVGNMIVIFTRGAQ